MQGHHILYAFFAVRYFVPMTIFMTPFLIESKKFTNKEIFNAITPFFFIASLFASLLGPVLVSKFGNKFVLLVDTGLELVCYTIFYYMPERSFALTVVTGLLHGIVTSFGSLTKGILMDNKPEAASKEKMFREHAAIKKFCGVLSSWMGQDMKYATGSHQCNLLFSFFTLCSSFVLCLFVPESHIDGSKKKLLELMFQGSFYSSMREIYTNDVLYFSLLNVIGSTLYISFAMYSASLFIERKKELDPSVNILGRGLYNLSKPIRVLTKGLIRVISVFDKSISYAPSYNKNTMIFGYIDGLSKLVAIICSCLLSLIFQESTTTPYRCALATVLVMIFTYLMGKTRSLMNSYIIFILGSTASQISFIWAYKGISADESVLHIILGLNLVASSIIHIIVSYYTKWRNYDVGSKILVYFWVNAGLLAAAFALQCCK